MNNTVSEILTGKAQNDKPVTFKPSERSQKFLLWLGLVSIAMLFAGLTSGYLVRRETGNWIHFEMPVQFWYSTAVMLFSSITMNMAIAASKKGKFDFLPIAVFITFALGIVFIVCQYMAWGALVRANVYLMGTASSASGSYLYIISGLHVVHVIGGLIALLLVFTKSVKRKYTVSNYTGVKICAIYWHFLDALWLYLFMFMLFAR